MKLVCPYERALIDRLDGRAVCVRVDAARDIPAAAADVRRRNALACVICDSSAPIEDIEIEDGWRDTPVALMAPSVGRFRNIAKKTGALRRLNLRVYLPCEADNLVGARVLASLGIPVCIVFDAAPDWDALADLMSYALLGLTPHAPIDPFQKIARFYPHALKSEDWGRAWFEDPARYLHIDAAGRIALSRRELMAGDFIASDVSELDSPKVREAIDNRTETWRSFFLEDHFCARCRAWRLCRGKFSGGRTEPDGCADFFDEMADVVEQYRNKQTSNGVAEKWRP